MRNAHWIVMAIFAAVSVAGAQSTGNGFFAVAADGHLVPLEHEVATFHSKMMPLPGYASVRTMAEIKPAHSPVTVSAAGAQLMIRDGSPADPQLGYELRALKSGKGHRQIEFSTAHATLLSATSSATLNAGEIPIRFERIDATSVRVLPVQPLAPGEYALTLRSGLLDFYCFRVE